MLPICCVSIKRDSPGDALTLVEERKVPLVGSVFDNRDRIAREFLRLLLKAGALQPKVLATMLGRRGTGE